LHVKAEFESGSPAPTQPILFYVALHFQNAFQIKLREPFTVTDWDVKRNTGLVDGMLAQKFLQPPFADA
jgi:hypothetical protein